jgi:hypothetical protein
MVRKCLLLSQRNNKCKNCIKMKNVNVHHKMKNVNVHHKMKNVNVHHYLFLSELSMCGTKISQEMTPVHIYT